MPRETFQCPHPCGEPLLTQAFTGGCPTLASSFGSVSYGVPAPLLWVLLCQNFVCALKDWNPCFPQSSGRPVVKPHWPSRPDYWGFSVLLSRLSGFPGFTTVGFRTFTILWELLWYYCSAVCGSPTWHVWDLILPWLHTSYLVAQMVKRLPTTRETQVQSLGWEDLLEMEMATHSSTLAWKIPWMEEPGRLQSMGSQRVGYDWATSLSLSPSYCSFFFFGHGICFLVGSSVLLLMVVQ